MFLRYNGLRLEADLLGGGTSFAELNFEPGGNVIVTDDNTLGKSTIVNALAVGLGFDDLVKGNIAALVKDTIKAGGFERRIGLARVYLDISNEKNERITIRREVNPRLSKGLIVQRTPLSEWSEQGAEEFYIGTGSYTDTKGFHRFLCDFIGFPDVKVLSYDEKETRLYLEYIFSAIFIEQKRGWADIMANSPFYRVREPKKMVISELIGLDYIQNNLKRNELKLKVIRLREKYAASVEVLKAYIQSQHFTVEGVPSDLVEGYWNPKIFKELGEGKRLVFEELCETAKKKLTELEAARGGDLLDEGIRPRLEELSDRVTSLVTLKGQSDQSVAIVDGNIRRYKQRLDALRIDLQKNREELRIRNLFNREKWSASNACPVCEQPVDGTLLSQLRSFPTMSIDENVKYISDQHDLIVSMIAAETAGLDHSKAEAEELEYQITSALDEQAKLQRSLTSSMPSVLMAWAREIAKLEKDIEIYQQLSDYLEAEFKKIRLILYDHERETDSLSLIKDDLSFEDMALLRKFEKVFRSFLQRMGFNSVEVGSMVVDNSSFLPKISVSDAQRRNVRADFGTSASDWIRIITAFVLALHECRGNSGKSIHPNVTVFDEPAQQNMNKEDALRFYDIVADVAKAGGQVIVAATDKEHSVLNKARALGMHVVNFGDNYVLKLDVI